LITPESPTHLSLPPEIKQGIEPLHAKEYILM